MRLEAEIALAECDTATAAERFEAALSLDPDWIVALSRLAQLRYAEGNLEQAERHLLEAMKSRDHSPCESGRPGTHAHIVAHSRTYAQADAYVVWRMLRVRETT